LGKRIIIRDILTLTLDPANRIGTFSIVIQDGLITRVFETPVPCTRQDLCIDGLNRVALPGFINGHVHGDVLLARGLGDGLSLHDQQDASLIGRKRWFRQELTAEARSLGRTVQYAEALKGGTTFLCDFLFWLDPKDDACGPFAATGIKGAVAFDYRRDFLTDAIREDGEIRGIIDTLTHAGLLPVLQGPSEESFDPAILSSVKSTAKRFSLPIQLHLSETRRRRDIVREKFAKSSVGFLKDIGFLDERVMGSHGVYLDETDLGILAASGSSIVNSPTAEMKIADGTAPVARMLSHGISVGLGTDGALWNDSSDMFREMKTLMLLQRVTQGASAFSSAQALYAATMGGARCFGIDRLYGSIEEGKRASLTLVDTHSPHLVPLYTGRQSNALQNIVSCAGAGDVDTVLVDGEIVVENGRLTKLD
jgi:5-methylthioadenosine/S-adenosylhomocysteine deaminase